jgi:5-methyltetrahydrofolate--homocysteine methyltransferase
MAPSALSHSSTLFTTATRPLVLDGAMGTSIQTRNLTDDDFHGLDGCNEILVLSRPDIITDIHADFLNVGVDLIETNTFGATAVVLAEYDIPEKAYEINVAAAKLAKTVAQQFSTPDHPRYVAGSVGPTTKLATLGHITYDALKRDFTVQMQGLMDGGADLLLIETCQDLLQVKAALASAHAVEKQLGRRIPKMVSVTIETTGTMLVGSDMATIVAALAPYDIDTLGMNCATGPEEMEEHIRTLSRLSPFGISCVPNAGIPENRGGCAHYHLTPDELTGYLHRFIVDYGVSVIGGCCGTRPDHLAPLVALARDVKPATRTPQRRSMLTSLYTATPMEMEPAPLLVGERTNANGSKKFKDLLALEDYDGLVEIGKGQVRKGAHVMDVCTAYVGRDEVKDMHETITRFNQQLDVPLMIDSTEAPVIEQSLKLIGGRAIVNSINLEDGEQRLKDVLPLCRELGAAVVALTIDEEGMAKTADKKLAIAQRIHDLCVNKYGMKSEDIVFDPLTFTLGSGDAEFRDAGTETIEAIRRIHEAMPGVGTILGVSNISFGLDKNARPILNSVFLQEAVNAGLTMAIVNSAHLLPMHRITQEERDVCLRLIYNRPQEGTDPVMEFMSYFENSDGKSKSSDSASNMPENLEQRLQYRIVDGNKTGLAEDLDEALKTYSALEIINTVLLEGMKTVGDLFGRGEMQLPFVLQSAETMKKAVAHLEPHMPKADVEASKGVCVLATVKGDVHDIGKNLVDIILTNNGYRVFNLGIKQPIETIAEVAEREGAHCIAMSGLLVKSTAIMKDNLQWMQQRDWNTPVILGGAALTQQFVEEDCQNQYRGPVVYARSAFDSLRTMDEIVTAKAQGKSFISPAQVKRNTVQTLPYPLEKSTAPDANENTEMETPQVKEKPAPRSNVTQGLPIPTPPFWGTKIVDVAVEDLYPFLNEQVLMNGHWGFRRGNKTRPEHEVFVAEKVQPILDRMKRETAQFNLLKPQVVYGYFPVQAEGDTIVVYDAAHYAETGEAKEFQRYPLPRGGAKNLCLTDYLAPVESGKMDVMPMTIVTVGQAATEYTTKLFANDEYTDYFFFHGFAVEMAEALAEYWHKIVRQELGITAKEAGKTPEELMRPSAYQGCRFSYGYPACPDLEDQVKLFEALEPGRIGIKLTESFLLEPEQSTSALIFHHPEAYYFDVRDGE